MAMTTGSDMQAVPAEAKKAVDEESRRLGGALSKLVLASIGAVSLAGETAGNWLHSLAERGQADVEHARARVRELRSQRPRLRRKPVIAVDTENLASKGDMEALKQQVAALSDQLAQLNKQSPGGA